MANSYKSHGQQELQISVWTLSIKKRLENVRKSALAATNVINNKTFHAILKMYVYKIKPPADYFNLGARVKKYNLNSSITNLN